MRTGIVLSFVTNVELLVPNFSDAFSIVSLVSSVLYSENKIETVVLFCHYMKPCASGRMKFQIP